MDYILTPAFLVLGTFFLFVTGYSIYAFIKLRKLKRELQETIDRAGTLSEQQERLSGITEQISGIVQSIEQKTAMQIALGESLAQLQQEQGLLEQKTQAARAELRHAQELTKKELELEAEKQRAEFQTKLDVELEELRRLHPKTELEVEVASINRELEVARNTLRLHQEQAKKSAQQEDFVAFHSISLTPPDLRDIELIRQFSPQLSRQDAIFKLIWSEFYQRPIQQLCKTVGCERVRGIYKITNTKNDRMYIGQAVDIAARWKDHCKTGLGIGSMNYKINKFYKALHQEGIENFTFEILEMGDIDLNKQERYWIEFFDAVNFGYNSKVG